MKILLALSVLAVTVQGLSSALRNQVQSLGRSALRYAVELGDLSLVEFFLDNGANTTGVARYAGRIAAEQPTVERMQIASLVLEKTHGINRFDEQGWVTMEFLLTITMRQH